MGHAAETSIPVTSVTTRAAGPHPIAPPGRMLHENVGPASHTGELPASGSRDSRSRATGPHGWWRECVEGIAFRQGFDDARDHDAAEAEGDEQDRPALMLRRDRDAGEDESRGEDDVSGADPPDCACMVLRSLRWLASRHEYEAEAEHREHRDRADQQEEQRAGV